MPGAVRAPVESLGVGASSDGVGLFVRGRRLGPWQESWSGSWSPPRSWLPLLGAGVVVSVSVAAVVVLAVFSCLRLAGLGFRVGLRRRRLGPESAFVAFFSADSLAADFDPCSSSVAPDFLLSAFSPSDEDESLFSSLAFVSLFLSLLSSDRSDLLLGPVGLALGPIGLLLGAAGLAAGRLLGPAAVRRALVLSRHRGHQVADRARGRRTRPRRGRQQRRGEEETARQGGEHESPAGRAEEPGAARSVDARHPLAAPKPPGRVPDCR